MGRLDWTVVATAAAGGLCVIVPGAALAAVFLDDRAQGWSWLFLAVILVGFALAGFLAGRARPDIPLAHGASAAFAAFVVAQAIGLVATIVRDESISLMSVVLAGLLALSMGVAGSLLADRLHRLAARPARGGRPPGDSVERVG